MFVFHNINDGESVHQRCVLITGQFDGSSGNKCNDGFVQISTANEAGVPIFADYRWPMTQGWFKSLVILNPGKNIVSFAVDSKQTEIVLHYIPLIQTPPLHLAIMVAKDSPLLIDCPPRKYGAISNTHSSLDAAIAKFRMTAYMWQALTAEDLRAIGLGRRSFRLEEEWGPESLLRESHTGKAKLSSTAKVHVVRVDKTVAELRDKNIAQQNPHGKRKNDLHKIFTDALKAHGAPFLSESCPVVAGMILDSTYDSESDLILAHAALGAHNPNGLSLGIFGSHLTYAWPRFVEEVPDCLLDTSIPGDKVGSDNGECATMWEACTVGQGAFLHEVGHAFAAPHTTGIMARGYSRDLAQCFLSRTSYSEYKKKQGVQPVTTDTCHDCHWDLADMLRFVTFPHFQLPCDAGLVSSSPPLVELQDNDDDFVRVIASCDAGIVKAALNGQVLESPSLKSPLKMIQWTVDELESQFDRNMPLKLEILARNSKQSITDIWSLLTTSSFIRLPGSTVRLWKKSVKSSRADNSSDVWRWAVMLKKRDAMGKLIPATKVDIRVGCSLDGAEVYYADKSKIPCGPRRKNGSDPGMGGHQARKMAIPRNERIVKVAVSKRGCLEGLRMWLSNGKAMGALNNDGPGSGLDIEYLVPDAGYKIIGFHGQSGVHGMCYEFGIVTAPEDRPLPDELYDMPELQNSPQKGAERPSKRRRMDQYSDTEDDQDTSEDEDSGYDFENPSDNYI